MGESSDKAEPVARGVLHPEGIRALRELAAGLAHEMNNALGVIVGNLHLAERQLPEEHPARRFLKEIGRVADESQLTTRGLASMARGAGATTRPVVLDMAVERAVSSAGAPADVELQVPDIRVDGDLWLIEETLSEVLRFLSDAPSSGRLRVRSELLGDQVELAIEDEGPPPISSELEKAFAPYQSLTGRGQAGLRLTQLAELADRCGGRARAEANEAGGLGLYLRLPVSRTEAP